MREWETGWKHTWEKSNMTRQRGSKTKNINKGHRTIKVKQET